MVTEIVLIVADLIVAFTLGYFVKALLVNRQLGKSINKTGKMLEESKKENSYQKENVDNVTPEEILESARKLGKIDGRIQVTEEML